MLMHRIEKLMISKAILCAFLFVLDAFVCARCDAQDKKQMDLFFDRNIGEQKPIAPEKTEEELAEEAVEAARIAEIESFIEQQLDEIRSGNPEQLESGKRELIERGPSILRSLPHLPSSASTEVRLAIDQVREALQSRILGESTKPSSITMEGSYPAVDALLEIMEQSGNKLQTQKLAAQDLEIDFSETPFWEALDEVADRLRLSVSPYGDKNGLKLIPAGKEYRPRSGQAIYVGSFRIEPTSVKASKQLDRDWAGIVELDFNLAWEPRLTPVFFRIPMRSVHVEFDNGQILPSITPQASPEYTPTESCALDAELMLIAPERSARKITRLSGMIEASVSGENVTIEFDDILGKNLKQQKVGQLQVTIERAELREEILEANILIKLQDSGEVLDSFRGWAASNECYLLDKKRKRIDIGGKQTYVMNSQSVGITYFFEVGESAEGMVLVYEAPGVVKVQQIEFLLRDIALP